MPEREPIKLEDFQALTDAFAPERLHPDLVPYVEDGSGTKLGWDMLRHPLVFQIPYLPAMNRSCNRMYEQKKKLVAQALADFDVGQVVWLHERPYRVDALLDMARRTVDPGAWLRMHPNLVLQLWADTEFPHQSAHKWRDIFRPFAHHGDGRVFLCDEDSQGILQESTNQHGTIEIWRGHGARGRLSGFSYSLSREVAEFFARRFRDCDEVPRISLFTVAPEDVVGYTNARSEREIIALPEDVNYIRTINL